MESSRSPKKILESKESTAKIKKLYKTWLDYNQKITKSVQLDGTIVVILQSNVSETNNLWGLFIWKSIQNFM